MLQEKYILEKDALARAKQLTKTENYVAVIKNYHGEDKKIFGCVYYVRTQVSILIKGSEELIFEKKSRFYDYKEILDLLTEKGFTEHCHLLADILSRPHYTFKRLHKLYMVLKIIKRGK